MDTQIESLEIEPLPETELDSVVGGVVTGQVTGGLVAQIWGCGFRMSVFATPTSHGWVLDN
jgi:hypothetical protein